MKERLFKPTLGFLDFFAGKRLQGGVLDLRVCFARAALSFEASGERPAARCAPGRTLRWNFARGIPSYKAKLWVGKLSFPGFVLGL